MNITETVLVTSRQDLAEQIAQLRRVRAVVQDRDKEMADAGEYDRKWPKLILAVIPSGEVLRNAEVCALVSGLARTGRKAGVSVRLIDTIAPLGRGAAGAVWPLEAFGGDTTLRVLAHDDDVAHVSFQQVQDDTLQILMDGA